MLLFFICSGYLYQRYSKVYDVRSWFRNVAKKALVLGILYVTFSTATWMLKTMFSDSVNNQAAEMLSTLFINPSAPYWYLYALFFIFLVTPTFRGMKMAVVGLVVALAAKLLILMGGTGIYAISTVFSNEIWFVLGTGICTFDVQLKSKRLLGIVCGVLFGILSGVVYVMDVQNSVVSFVLGLITCAAIVVLMAGCKKRFGKVMDFFTKYTMSIFLMHVLFAASLRAVLLKIGVTNSGVHVVLGLGISLAGPIVVAWIMKKIKWLEFFLYPSMVIKNEMNSISK